MEAKHNEIVGQKPDTVRPCKRKRSVTSLSSCPDPAAPSEFSQSRKDKHRKHHSLSTEVREHHRDESSSESSKPETSLDTPAPSPAQVRKSYERRPRHKTRQDKYEIKHGKQKEKQSTERKVTSKNHKRRAKHRDKAGAALLHNFSAENIASDRITVCLDLFGGVWLA